MRSKSVCLIEGLVILACADAARSADVILSRAGEDWKYKDDGSNLGTIWRSPFFNDSDWAIGTAQLGYGDGDEETVVSYGPDPSNKYITTYFRRSFTVDDRSIFTGLQVLLLRDDGAIVYLNGAVILRSNMPTGIATYTTPATSVVSGSDESTWYSAIVPLGPLLNGMNVLAVEIHQSDAQSSDISFDLQLVGQTTAPDLINAGSTWRYLDNGSNQGTAWRETEFNDSTWASGPAQLGYGDGDEATIVSYGSSASNKHITTYFRRAINVSNPLDFGANLTLSVLRDDGAIVYLNGTEVFRDGLPNGNVQYNTPANQVVGYELENRFVQTLVPASLLVPGTNVIAAEIHQSDPASSDLSFDLSLVAAPLVNPTVTRGPYLQSASPTSMVVRWRTNVPTDSLVQCGTTLGDFTWTFQKPGATTDHEVTMTGMMPVNKYFYTVGSTSGIQAGNTLDHYFVTPPTAETQKPSRIWVLGDSGYANSSQTAVRDAYYAFTEGTHTDLWIMLGDNAYIDGTDAQYQTALFNSYASLLRKSVLWPALGNHDTHSCDSPTSSGVYFDIFTLPKNGECGGTASGTEAYFSFDHADIHFIVLDSDDSPRAPTGAMLTWLAADLAATDKTWIIAFWHHPPYSKGGHNSDNASDSGGRMRDMRENALPILEAGGVDLVMTGHSHSYERSYLLDGHYGTSNTLVPSMVIDGGDGRFRGDGGYVKPTARPNGHEGTVYVVAGSSSQATGGSFDHPAMYISMSALGSVVLDIDGGRLEAKFLGATGAVHDCFTIFKGRPESKGDLNCDGAMNLEDIGPFTAALLATLSSDEPEDGENDTELPCPQSTADLNGDGLINGLDIEVMTGELLKGLCP
jgi:hypothetical protein